MSGPALAVLIAIALVLTRRRDPEISFRSFRGQADHASGFAGGARGFIFEEALDNRAGVFIPLNDDWSDDLAVEIQGQRRQGLLRRDGERLHVAVALPTDLHPQFLGLHADFASFTLPP